MSMSREAFDALVARLEGEAKEHPARYRFRVLLLALLGYAYILFVLLVVVLLLALLVVGVVLAKTSGYALVKIGIPLAGLAILILRALWVRLPPPAGLVLTRAQTPRLFETTDEISGALQSPRMHVILLTGEFNASVSQIPRLGVFGWYKNYLAVGLPLMLALSPEQLRAVLAHEFGHLSRAHARFSGWIYRIGKTWNRLMEVVEQKRHWGSFAFRRFFDWYAPFFWGYSFVLSRAHEYVADRCAADLVGAQNMAGALAQTAVYSAFFDRKFWPDVFKGADDQADPPTDLYDRMQRFVQRGADPEEARQWLGHALQAKTGNDDTHPALADRMAALGCAPPAPEAVAESAAERFLGAMLQDLKDGMGLVWQSAAGASWRGRHEGVLKSRQELAGLEEKSKTQALTTEEAWKRAHIILDLQGDEAALLLYQDLVAKEPDYALAQFDLGRILLAQGNAEGIERIERAMKLDSDGIMPGCEAIFYFLMSQGRAQEAERYRQIAIQRAQVLEEARAERSDAGPKDTYLPHGLSPEQVEPIKDQLRGYPYILKAYLVRKATKHFPELPLYCLGIVVRIPWYKPFPYQQDTKVLKRLAEEGRFPGETLILLLNRRRRKISKVMRKISGSCIYHR